MMTGFPDTLLEGSTVLVTGAGKGIGRACASMTAASGARVIAVARTPGDLESLAAEHPGQITAWAMDVTSEPFIERVESLERLEGLICNAGTNRVGPMVEQGAEDLDAVLELNVRSVWRLSRAAIGPMQRAGGGSIVHMSSQMGHVGSPGRTLYCMSKHAVEGLVKAMAVELAEQNIRVNSVAPTFVKTPLTEPMLEDPGFRDFVLGMIPTKRLATPEDVANGCVFLLSRLSAATTGTCLKIDGGWTAQ